MLPLVIYLKIQKLIEKYVYYCICYYLAECIGSIANTVLYKIKKYIFACSAGALGPGLAGLCLKTALVWRGWTLLFCDIC